MDEQMELQTSSHCITATLYTVLKFYRYFETEWRFHDPLGFGKDFSNMAPGLQLDHQKPRQMASSRAQNARMYQTGLNFIWYVNIQTWQKLQQHDTKRFLKPGLCSDESFWNQNMIKKNCFSGQLPENTHIVFFHFKGYQTATSSVWCLFNG